MNTPALPASMRPLDGDRLCPCLEECASCGCTGKPISCCPCHRASLLPGNSADYPYMAELRAADLATARAISAAVVRHIVDGLDGPDELGVAA